MQDYKQQFIRFALSRNVLKFGRFSLKSGRQSPYFFNAGLFNRGADLARLGDFYAAAVNASGVDFDVIFGPAYKGIPIGTAAAVALFNRFGVDKPVCFNRKEEKDHGEGGKLIGAPLQGNVLLVDDVITAGTAIRESMALIAANRASLSAVLIALDRKERGKGELSAVQEAERDYRCRVLSIIDADDLMRFLETDDDYREFLPAMRVYRQQYGV